MQLTIHIATVDHPDAYHEFSSTSLSEVNMHLAAWCREHWRDHYAETVTVPDTDEETIELYFCKASDDLPGFQEILHRIETEITLPQPYATAPDLAKTLLSVLTYYGDTSHSSGSHGEEMTNAAEALVQQALQIRCPAFARHEGDPKGCGSTNLLGPDSEGMFDCGDCGLFFTEEAATRYIAECVDCGHAHKHIQTHGDTLGPIDCECPNCKRFTTCEIRLSTPPEHSDKS